MIAANGTHRRRDGQTSRGSWDRNRGYVSEVKKETQKIMMSYHYKPSIVSIGSKVEPTKQEELNKF